MHVNEGDALEIDFPLWRRRPRRRQPPLNFDTAPFSTDAQVALMRTAFHAQREVVERMAADRPAGVRRCQ